MRQRAIPAAFVRGGTSKAIVFHARDLPDDRRDRDAIFLAAIGSPDPNGRQLDGMGGGVSSLSKVCVIGPPSRPDADLDYTFAQVSIGEARVDYGANCGNMSAAMGPFAIDEGLVRCAGDEALVRIHNTNTGKIIWSRFPLDDGRAAVDGDLAIPGVAGTGALVRLEFLEPGGAATGRLLPTGNVADRLEVPGIGPVQVSMVDAANPCVFVNAADIGLTGTELPEALERDHEAMHRLAAIRIAASVAMGIGSDPGAARRRSAIPFVGFVSPAQQARTLSGAPVSAADADFTARMISNGQPHRALPLTCALCLAVAAHIEGSVVHAVARRAAEAAAPLRLAMPSGVLTVGATVVRHGGEWHAEQGAFYRTQRRLFDGRVYVPAARVPA